MCVKGVFPRGYIIWPHRNDFILIFIRISVASRRLDCFAGTIASFIRTVSEPSLVFLIDHGSPADRSLYLQSRIYLDIAYKVLIFSNVVI